MNLGYVISTIIASLVLLSLVALNSRIVRGSGEQTLYTMAKIQSDMVVDYVKDDMRSMGYRVDGNAIVYADANCIRFLVRFEGDESPTAIDWWFNSGADPIGQNDNIRPLYRRQVTYDSGDDPDVTVGCDFASDPDAVSIATGIVEFEFVYLDDQRQPVTDPQNQLDNIRQIQLSMIVENMESYGNRNQYVRSTWRGEITPFNLNLNMN